MGKLTRGGLRTRGRLADVRADFAPTQIVGLKAWWDASDASTITSSSGAVSQWNDKSGNGFNLTQSTAGNKPTTGTQSYNGRNALAFDGGDYLSRSGTTSLNVNAVTVVCVVEQNGAPPTNNAGIVSFFDSGAVSDWNNVNGFAVETGSGTNWTGGSRNGTASGSPYVPGSGAVPFDVWVVRFFTGSGGNVTAYRGSSGAASTGTSSAGTYGVAAGGIQIGARWLSGAIDTGVGFLGNICEVVVYSVTLADADVNLLGNYLKSKWGTSAWVNL